MSSEDLLEALNEAMDLLSNAGPNPLCIDSEEYYDRLDKLREKCGLNEDDEEE